MIQSRLIYGFLNKRSSGKVKFFQRRWFFLISSRPLSLSSYLNDPRVMDDSLIPPLLELDTMYQYNMDKPGDDSGVAYE